MAVEKERGLSKKYIEVKKSVNFVMDLDLVSQRISKAIHEARVLLGKHFTGRAYSLHGY